MSDDSELQAKLVQKFMQESEEKKARLRNVQDGYVAERERLKKRSAAAAARQKAVDEEVEGFSELEQDGTIRWSDEEIREHLRDRERDLRVAGTEDDIKDCKVKLLVERGELHKSEQRNPQKGDPSLVKKYVEDKIKPFSLPRELGKYQQIMIDC